MTDVLVDEDCTRTVARMPSEILATGLENKSLCLKALPLLLPPKTLNALPIKPSEMMNMYNKRTTKINLEVS
jgi:hypothetical protein